MKPKTVKRTGRAARGGAAGGTRTKKVIAKKPRSKSKKSANAPAFPLLAKKRGFGVRLQLADSTGDKRDQIDVKFEWVVPPTNSGGGGMKGGRKPRINDHTIAATAAVGHPVRAKLLAKLLEAPATYQALKRTCRLEPGPLYFHINQLRGAGLMMPKQRDLYELTRGGRNLILALFAMGSMIQDRRRCPVS